MATNTTAGTYKGVPITPGSDANIAQQVAAINAGGSSSSSNSGSSGTNYTPGQVQAINTARENNYNAGINVYTGAGATAASDAAGKGNTPVSSAPITPPTTTTNTPVDTAQPSPTTVNATPYTAPQAPAVDAAAAQQNLLKGGLTGSALAAAQKSLSAFQQGHGAAVGSGLSAPQDAGTGMSVAGKVAEGVPQAYAPAPEVQDAVSKATQKYTDDFAKAMSSQDQSKSLVEQYQDFTKQLGIPELNTQLMNMKNVIDGTEDDIRNEVTKAGGFATDSQVLAMTNSRNKVMIQNYNNLLQTRSDAMQQLTTLTGLAAQDRAFAAEQIDRQLNFDQQQITFATNAQKNAQDSIQKSLDNYGAAAVLKQALATGDPQAVARINATMGNGFDLNTAALTPTLDEQMKKANIAQSYASINASNAAAAASNRANRESEIVIDPKYAGVIQTILGSGKFTKAQAAQIATSINSGNDPVSVIRNQAKNIMGQTEATTVTQYETAQSALNDLQSSLAEYYSNGGKTGVFSGNTEKVINKLGNVKDPKLVNIATQIQSQLQIYRNAVSGTAYSAQEGKDINSIFPGINKSSGLNTAIIDGRMQAFQSTIDGTYESTLGANTYQGVVAASGGKGQQSSSSFVERTLSNAGINYNDFVSKVPSGTIPVVNNQTGQIGHILPAEYNSATYTRI